MALVEDRAPDLALSWRDAIAGLGFGGAPIGNLYCAISDEAAHDAVAAAWACGIRHFDTAPLYGNGLSELRLGAALAKKARDAFVLSSKVGRILEAGAGVRCSGAYIDPRPLTIRQDYSRDGVIRSVEDSLKRLDVDRIDILYVHDLEPGSFATNAEYDAHFRALTDGGWRALADLRAAGVVRAIGAGVNQVAACERMLGALDPDVFLLAGRYTLLDRSADALLDACTARGVAIVAGGVFNSGVLARGPDAPFDYAATPAAVRARVRAMQAICADHDVPLAAAALAFVLNEPRIASVLVGAQSVDEIETNVALAALPVPHELLDALLNTANAPRPAC